jgi:hypothetical protein
MESNLLSGGLFDTLRPRNTMRLPAHPGSGWALECHDKPPSTAIVMIFSFNGCIYGASQWVVPDQDPPTYLPTWSSSGVCPVFDDTFQPRSGFFGLGLCARRDDQASVCRGVKVAT